MKAVMFHEFGGLDVLELEEVPDLQPALGEGVTGWEVGERVLPYLMSTCGQCIYCTTGRESLCLTPGFISFSTSGGYAERLVCPAGHLLRVPDALSDEQAAALQIAFAT